MRSYVRKPIKAEQFDGSQKMIHKYHISVYNENGDKYGGSIIFQYIMKMVINMGDLVAQHLMNIHLMKHILI